VNHRRITFALLVLAWFLGASAGSSIGPTIPQATLERALESGCSLVVAEILEVYAKDRMYYYKPRIVRAIVAGDLAKEQVYSPPDLFAGASYGTALKPGSRYAMFIQRDYPYEFAWAFRDDVIEVDPSDEEAVRRLVEVADRVYARTSIRRFRRTTPWVYVKPPDLPDELASLCKQFREQAGRRAEVGRKIAASDLGSRIDDSKPFSSIRTYLPPKISLFRQQVLALFGEPTWRNGWMCSWCCDDFVHAHESGDEIGILSVAFDKTEKATSVLFYMQERSKWIRPARSADHLANADGDPVGVARAFQDALRESNWQQALSYCSQQVKAKAGEFDSEEAFFKRFVPVEQIVALPGFSPREFSGRDGRTVRMSARVGIDVPGAKWPVEWGWTLVKTGQTWWIDFEVMSLENFVRKELLRREFMERRPRIQPEEFARAIEFFLSPVGSEFVIGKPMPFRVEMRNVGGEPISYTRSASVMTGDPMLVTGPDGQTVPYVDVSYQIGVALDVILPGETIVLADRYDVTSQYRIVQAGRYRFQFRGWPRESELSNVCEVDVKPGVLSDVDRISQDLLSVLPSGWDFERMPSSPPDYDEEAGAGQLYINLIGQHAGKGGDKGVFLLILRGGDPTDTDPWLKEDLDLWGLSPWGPVYARVNQAEQLWPDHRAKIERALGVEPVR
jgi:hypothetical protein